MDQDLVDYLERRFGQLHETLDSRFVQIDDRLVGVDGRFTQIDRRFDRVEGRLDHVDRRFEQIHRRFDHIDGQLAVHDTRFDHIDGRLAAHDTRFDHVEGRLAAHDARFEQIEITIRESAAETRRHFGVLAEQLRSDIQSVAEGVVALDQKLEHFRVEVNQRFGTVETCLARLEARRP